MTLQECYEKLNGNYEDVKMRIQMDKLIDKFILKFPNDKTMEELTRAVNDGDIEASFDAAHTLKGLSANLGFEALTNAVSALTEQLRSRENKADEDLYKDVLEKYELAIKVIKEYEAEK